MPFRIMPNLHIEKNMPYSSRAQVLDLINAHLGNLSTCFVSGNRPTLESRYHMPVYLPNSSLQMHISASPS